MYAESTPRGRGGISLLRISGASTRDIIARLTSRSQFEPHRQTPSHVHDPQGAVIDQVMVVFHPGPRSYTGEDLSEISCHGNPNVVDAIMDLIRQTGLARMAEKGEFSKRAFLSGKMDLVQAEAVCAMINAGSAKGIEMAQSLIRGELSDRINALSEGIAVMLAEIEASFITDDEDIRETAIGPRIEGLVHQIEGLLADAEAASPIYEGVITTIAGLPNVGKSSLFNAILGFPRAIVHHEEGTTRDVLRERLRVNGIDYLFHDTAGIRETVAGPEKIGVEKTMEALRNSDLVLYVVDAREGLNAQEMQWLGLCGRTIVVMNKMDLAHGPGRGIAGWKTVQVSAKNRTGIDDLLEAMRDAFPQDQPLVFLERHAYLLGMALDSLKACEEALVSGYTADVVTIDLRQALSSLRQLTGQAFDENVLERIFSSFCIGK
ncbi:MAG: tRNA uridine-5-carboxymethylaminomethyl(34) synthesis GTPase MnmE [Syntrophaceae bacterium]